MKVYVKERPDGNELVFSTFAEFQVLWRQRFIDENDLVRREGSTRWIRAGDLPELRAVRLNERRANLQWMQWVAIGATLITFVLALLFQRSL